MKSSWASISWPFFSIVSLRRWSVREWMTTVESVRASMGALFTQRIATAPWEDFVAWLRSGPGELIGTSLKATQDYQQPRYAKPAFILVGNEAQCLPEAYEAECDTLVKIPMLGKADSLNAAVATAVMAYEALHQVRGMRTT